MNITLINPALFGFEARWDKVAQDAPLGILYIAAILEKEGHKVSVIEGEAEPLTDSTFIEKVKAFNPDIVGITTVITKHNQMSRTLKLLKKIKTFKIVLGGPHATLTSDEIMKNFPEVDFIVYGEGEYTFRELVQKLTTNKPLDEIKGLIYREKNEIKKNPPRPLIENLDELPFPARHLLSDITKYKNRYTYKALPMTSMLTSRGCPFRCLFCNRFFGRKYRQFSAKYIVSEMKMLKEKYGIKEICFWDDVFLLNVKRAKEICDLMKKEKLGITWSCLGRINVFIKNKWLLKEMKEAGCWYIRYGIESGNQKVLDFIKKDLKLEDVKEVVEETVKQKIYCRGFFMIAHPIDTKETIRDTIDFAKSLPLDGVQFNLTIPYPNSELYEIAENYGTFDKQYENMSGHSLNPPFIPFGLTKDYLIDIQKQAYKEFYFRPEFILKHLMKIRNKEDIKKYAERAWTYFKVVFFKNRN